MFKVKLKNPLAVNENDTIGSAAIKGLTSGYIKGTLASGVGLGVLALTINYFSKKGKSKKKEEKVEKPLEEVSTTGTVEEVETPNDYVTVEAK